MINIILVFIWHDNWNAVHLILIKSLLYSDDDLRYEVLF